MSGHFSWHIMSRGCAYDVVNEHVKSFCREISCRTAPIRALDFTRIEFGWIARFHPDMGPDVFEYVLSRGAAWDCPFSIRLTLADAAAHPRAEDCFDTIKTWEDARIAGKLTDAQRTMLKTLDPKDYRIRQGLARAVFCPNGSTPGARGPSSDQEHHLFVNERGEYELVPIREVPGVAGGRVKAFLFQRAGPTRRHLRGSLGQPGRDEPDAAGVARASDGDASLRHVTPVREERIRRRCPRRQPTLSASGRHRSRAGDPRLAGQSDVGQRQRRLECARKGVE